MDGWIVIEVLDEEAFIGALETIDLITELVQGFILGVVRIGTIIKQHIIDSLSINRQHIVLFKG